MNQEGYKDPTAEAAIRVSERKKPKYMPLVYICSPYSGDVEKNIEKAKKYSRYALQKGYIPIAPHLYLPQFMDDKTERELAMFIDLVLLSKCTQIWVFGDEITNGMAEEITRAMDKNMPVRRMKGDCFD